MNLEQIPTEEIVVNTKPSGIKSKVGEEEFVKELIGIVKSGPVWRTSKKLAEILKVDILDLSNWLDKQPEIARKPGKEDGIVYYASIRRLEEDKEKCAPGMERKQITEEDRYAIAMLHQAYTNFSKTLEKYGMHIYGRNKEALAKLSDGRESLSAGIVLFAHTLKIDVTKLP